MAVTQSELPIEEPIKIVKGDDFRSRIIRLKDINGYIDTSGWTITAAIYASAACGAAKLQDLVVEHQPAPEYGYLLSLPAVDTAGLSCADNHYRVPTINLAGDKKTYTSGLAEITGA